MIQGLKAFPNLQLSMQVKMTLLLALFSVPINTVWGIIAAIQITRSEFWGKTFVMSMLDLPFSISPVVTGIAAYRVQPHLLLLPMIFAISLLRAHRLHKEDLPCDGSVPRVEVLRRTSFHTHVLLASVKQATKVHAGLMLVLLYGREGWFSPVLRAANFNVVFAFPGTCIPHLLYSAMLAYDVRHHCWKLGWSAATSGHVQSQ